MAKNSLQKLFEAGVQFGEMSRQQAEAAVKKLVKAGDVRRSETEAMVQGLIERGHETAVAVAESVQQEVARQLGWLATRVDDVEDQVETLVRRLTSGAADSGTGSDAGEAAPAKRAAKGTTSTAKKATAKKSTPRKATAKKSSRKSAAAKRSTAASRTTATAGAGTTAAGPAAADGTG